MSDKYTFQAFNCKLAFSRFTSKPRAFMMPDDDGKWVDRHTAEHLVDMLKRAEARIAELENREASAPGLDDIPGGHPIDEARLLLNDLVSAHTCKAITRERMNVDRRFRDLSTIKNTIVRAAWFVRSIILETEKQNDLA